MKAIRNNTNQASLNSGEHQSKSSGRKNLFIQVEKFLNARYGFRNNVVLNRIELRKHNQQGWIQLNENNIYRELQHHSIHFSQSNVIALFKSDFVKPYDPFIQYFESLPKWNPKDSPNHIKLFSKYIKAKDKEWFYIMLTKWLIRSIKCAIEPTFYNKNALILVGEKQNSGKSTWCRRLCPALLSEYISENIGTDKDSLISLSENLIINLDELSTLQKSDLQSLKSLFSKDRIKTRRPYERTPSTSPRRASFVGSTDRPEFLSDDSGSVRWVCIEIDGIDWGYNSCSIDNVWSQAFYYYTNGEDGELSKEEIAKNETNNRIFYISTLEEELIVKYFKIPAANSVNIEYKTTTEIKKYIFQKEGLPLNIQPLGKAMRRLGFGQKSKRINSHHPIKVYSVELVEQENQDNLMPSF